MGNYLLKENFMPRKKTAIKKIKELSYSYLSWNKKNNNKNKLKLETDSMF